MIIKDLETIQHIVFRLEAIVETRDLDRYDKLYIVQAIASLQSVCTRHELDADDTDTVQKDSG